MRDVSDSKATISLMLYLCLTEDLNTFKKVNHEVFCFSKHSKELYDRLFVYIEKAKKLPSFEKVTTSTPYACIDSETLSKKTLGNLIDATFAEAKLSFTKEVTSKLSNAVKNGQLDEIHTITKEFNRKLALCSVLDAEKHVRAIEDVLTSYTEELEICRISGTNMFVSSGDSFLDSIYGGGFRKGNVYALSAREKVGKTSFLLSWAKRCWKSGNKVLLVSGELTEEEMALKIALPDFDLTEKDLMLYKYNPYDIEKIVSFSKGRENSFLFWDSQTTDSLDGVVRICEEYRPDILFLDSAQMIKAHDKMYAGTSRDNVNKTVARLKDISKKFKIPVVITIHINRDFEDFCEQNAGIHFPKSKHLVESDLWGRVLSSCLGMVHGFPENKNTRLIQVMFDRHDEIKGKIYEASFIPELNFLREVPSKEVRSYNDIASFG